MQPGRRVMMTGKFNLFKNQPQLQHPDFVLMDGPTQATGSLRQLGHYGDIEEILAGREWLPIYPAQKLVSTWTIMGAVHTVLQSLPEVAEPLGFTPEGYISLDQAVRQIHEPGPAGPAAAVRRLKYDEALSVALAMQVRRHDTAKQNAPALPIVKGRDQAAMLERLPFLSLIHISEPTRPY